jgi:hypothetical protein
MIKVIIKKKIPMVMPNFLNEFLSKFNFSIFLNTLPNAKI